MRARLAIAAMFAVAAWGQTRASAVFIDGSGSQVLVNSTMQLTAVAYDANGNPLPSAQVTWNSSDKTAFTVDSRGLVQAVGLGWADITAAATGATGTLRLQAVPSQIVVRPANQTIFAGDSLQYTADVLDANGNPLQGAPIQWRAFGPNAGQDNVIFVDSQGAVSTFGWGTFYVEAYYNYTVGSGPFIPRFYGNTRLTVLPRQDYQAKRLLDSSVVRQSFELRPRRGQISVNDAGQIAYTGSLEGFTTAALVWSGGVFNAVAVSGTPAEMPGTSLLDVDTPAFNNNGEIAARCIVAPTRNCLLFAGSDGVPHMLYFDGSAAGGANNLRNFLLTRYSLNDNSTMLFRADYWGYGSTVNQTGLFTSTSTGSATLAVPAGTRLPGMASGYSFNGDFGIDNNGAIVFSVTNGSASALYRMAPDNTITRVIGTGDQLNGSPVLSISTMAMGKNGHYAVMANNGTQNLLLFSGDPAKFRQLPVTSYTNILAVSGKGDVAVVCSLAQTYGLYRWDGATTRPVAPFGFPTPVGDPYTQFDSAGFTSSGDVIVQARTANDLFLVVNAGAAYGSRASVLFGTGARVNVAAGPSFYNLVLNGHMGNPMIKTGWYVPSVFEISGGLLIPRLIPGDRTPDGWFFEGNQDVRRNGDGDLLVSTDQSVSRVGASTALLAHFPQRTPNGNINTFYQVVGNTSGLVAGVGGTGFGVNHLSVIQNGAVKPIAWLGVNGSYRTPAPGGGNFASSSDLGVAEDGTVYAYLRVNGGSDGIFAWNGSQWTSLLRIGDAYDGFTVTSIGTIRVAGNAVYATVTSGLNHLARYQNGKWIDLISIGDAIPAGNTVTAIGSFDVNRKGGVAAALFSNGSVQYIVYVDDSGMHTIADSVHGLENGQMLVNIFQVSVNDDGRVFVSAIDTQEMMVIYEFDPAH